jgi:uroporphyrinogen decarboxylase
MDKPLLRALAGERLDPPPVWLMRQAGRYLPEYRTKRAQVADTLALFTRPDAATEITLQPVRRFGMDGAILYSDILILPWALGADLRYVEGEGPRLSPVRDAAAFEALAPVPDPARIAPVLETVRRVRAMLPDACTLIGFAGAPFTVACYMVDGRGGGEFPHIRLMAYRDPALLDRLIARLAATTTDLLASQVAAGAECVMLFDSWAGILPPSLFERLVVAPTRAIVAGFRARCPGVRIIGFPRLAGTAIGRYAAATGVDAVALDTAADPALAASLVPAPIALQGNLDPLALLAGGAAMRAEADRVRRAFGNRAHIFNLGHGVLPQTPPEHVADLVRSLRGG